MPPVVKGGTDDLHATGTLAAAAVAVAGKDETVSSAAARLGTTAAAVAHLS